MPVVANVRRTKRIPLFNSALSMCSMPSATPAQWLPLSKRSSLSWRLPIILSAKTLLGFAASRLDLAQVLKIAILAEKYVSDYSWYVDTILRLLRIAGDYVVDEVAPPWPHFHIGRSGTALSRSSPTAKTFRTMQPRPALRYFRYIYFFISFQGSPKPCCA